MEDQALEAFVDDPVGDREPFPATEHAYGSYGMPSPEPVAQAEGLDDEIQTTDSSTLDPAVASGVHSSAGIQTLQISSPVTANSNLIPSSPASLQPIVQDIGSEDLRGIIDPADIPLAQEQGVDGSSQVHDCPNSSPLVTSHNLGSPAVTLLEPKTQEAGMGNVCGNATPVATSLVLPLPHDDTATVQALQSTSPITEFLEPGIQGSSLNYVNGPTDSAAFIRQAEQLLVESPPTVQAPQIILACDALRDSESCPPVSSQANTEEEGSIRSKDACVLMDAATMPLSPEPRVDNSSQDTHTPISSPPTAVNDFGSPPAPFSEPSIQEEGSGLACAVMDPIAMSLTQDVAHADTAANQSHPTISLAAWLAETSRLADDLGAVDCITQNARLGDAPDSGPLQGKFVISSHILSTSLIDMGTLRMEGDRQR